MTLLERINAHLAQAAPHQLERAAGKLLIEAGAALEEWNQVLAEGNEALRVLSLLLNRTSHVIDPEKAGDAVPGHEPCIPGCPRCAWELIKLKLKLNLNQTKP